MAELTFRERKTARWILLSVAVVLAVIAGITSMIVCLPAWIGSGVLIDQCPDGRFRQTLRLDAAGLHRSGRGRVSVGAIAHYTTGPATSAYQADVSRISADLFLVGASGAEKALPVVEKEGWWDDGSGESALVELPDVPDGDYKLRAKVKTPIEEGTIDLELPLYAPARIHVITDRPLYQPGQTVLFRALALRAKDLSPLDGRPGKWIVTAPDGQEMMVEKSPAAGWGVAEGSFPIDSGAASGTWSVRWASGGSVGTANFTVEPFRLPRFRIEAETPRAFYRAGETPRLRGSVRYASGAPVSGAALQIQWSVSGDWPPPTSWLEGALRENAAVDAAGRFDIELPVVPADLQGQATLFASIAATDPAGDRVEGSAAILLSQDAIKVTTVTEIGDGLVEGFNNRLYLRVTTADGVALPKAALTVKRAWENSDKGARTETDEDGVAALQIDPGPAVNVVIPPPPFRRPQREPAASLSSIRDLISGEEPTLADQRVMDVWPRAFEPCARFASDGASEVSLAIRVDPSGAVTSVSDDGQPATRCLTSVLRARRLPPGRDRLYSMSISLDASELPSVSVEIEGAPFQLDELERVIATAAADARSCLPDDVRESSPPRSLFWRTVTKERALIVGWIPSRDRSLPLVSPAIASCIESKFARLSLSTPANADTLGIARLYVHPSPRMQELRPQATVMLGYELEVTAVAGDETLGKTKVRLNPGNVPPVRLRATPVLASAGGPVDVEILRGPGFSGELPEKLYLTPTQGKPLEALVDKEKRSARFTLPAQAKGWFEIQWYGARAMVFVRDEAQLQVSLRPEKERYSPGEKARLLIETKVGGAGTQAAVGLIGVDNSLAQLVPLPGPDELSILRPRVETAQPAFGLLDGQALTMGRIRGSNAAQATVLRVTSLPRVEDLDLRVNASTYGRFDPLEPLTDRFYTALGELHAAVRVWEKDAPETEQMKPATMARLWNEALAAAEKRGVAVDDAYGRRLRLSQLPPELLALTSPQAVVVQGTRLPEDVEDWASWVGREQP